MWEICLLLDRAKYLGGTKWLRQSHMCAFIPWQHRLLSCSGICSETPSMVNGQVSRWTADGTLALVV
jgi:hypothetical protein